MKNVGNMKSSSLPVSSSCCSGINSNVFSYTIMSEYFSILYYTIMSINPTRDPSWLVHAIMYANL
jgi:hypothetical protein